MIAAGLGAKAALPGRSGGAVGRHPGAEARDLADEAALGVGRRDRPPGLGPFAVDKHAAHSEAPPVQRPIPAAVKFARAFGPRAEQAAIEAIPAERRGGLAAILPARRHVFS